MKVKPTRKVAAGSFAGLAATLIVSVASANGIEVPPDAAAGLTALFGMIASWATKDKQ